MSLAEIKREMEQMTSEERRHLTAHLVALERKKAPTFREGLARKIDNTTPTRWMTPDEARNRLQS